MAIDRITETECEKEICPNCGADEVLSLHGFTTSGLETFYKACEMCNHQWGHQ